MMNVILIVFILWILPCFTGMMWWQEKKGKGLVMGVRLSSGFQDDKEVKAIQHCYKRELIGITICLFPVPFIGFLIPYDSIILTMDMLWLGLVFLLPVLAFCKGHKKVKAKKQREGYAKETGNIRLVDTKAATLSRKVSHWSFMIATAISGIPVLLAAVMDMEKETKIAVVFVLVVLAVITPVFWLVSMSMVRTRSEIISDNSTVNENFLRTKCRIWDVCMQRCAWVNAAFVVLTYVLMMCGTNGRFWSNQGMAIILLCVAYCVALVVLILLSGEKINRIRLRLSEKNTGNLQEEDDEYWLCGMFYYNPNDTHCMVDKRIGTGTTVNFATKGGKIAGIFTVAGLLIVPIVCIWMLFEEFTPISLAITDEHTVVVSHLKKVYEVDTSDIKDVKLVEQLSDHGKLFGTAMQSLEKGSFESEEYGTFQACLNPKKGPYLLIRTTGKTYIFADGDEGTTRVVFEQLQQESER